MTRVRLEFKFRQSVPQDRRAHVIEEVERLGAEHVEPLFPDERDPELASLYKIEGVPDRLTENILSALDRNDAIEFAEPTPSRKLVY